MTMQADNRPTRKRKIPARLASPSTQIETVTLSEGRTESKNAIPTTYPATPVLSPTSSVFSDTSSPCPATRTTGSRRRANPRGKSPTRSEICPSSASQTPSTQTPVQTIEDEYNIDSLFFGLKHTPEWNEIGINTDDRSQPRWFPPGMLGPPTLESLTSGSKLMLIQELTKQMTFKTLVDFLQLTDRQLIHITQVYENEAQRDELEREYTLAATKQLEVIRRSRAVTVEDWNYALEEELHSKLPHTATNSPIPLLEIGKTIAYLKTFNVQEDLEGTQVDILEGTNVVLPDDFPSFQVIEQVIEEMMKYTRLGVGMEWDFGHEIGLRAYIYSETELAGDGDEGVMMDDEGGDKAVEPVRRPVGRPRKRDNNRLKNISLPIYKRPLKAVISQVRIPLKNPVITFYPHPFHFGSLRSLLNAKLVEVCPKHQR
ncbi:hypothetical protein EYC80_003295 [Monilinia laxa]|uniref:Uncharacterized protein n=1 Tax=Monilinia laxa TaxID=61186 RepID=A0A5N6KDL8_MONLA|nr:hypothetical protein EYC80_003295 [Monilinia laxa]